MTALDAPSGTSSARPLPSAWPPPPSPTARTSLAPFHTIMPEVDRIICGLLDTSDGTQPVLVPGRSYSVDLPQLFDFLLHPRSICVAAWLRSPPASMACGLLRTVDRALLARYVGGVPLERRLRLRVPRYTSSGYTIHSSSRCPSTQARPSSAWPLPSPSPAALISPLPLFRMAASSEFFPDECSTHAQTLSCMAGLPLAPSPPARHVDGVHPIRP
ncbi:hypothetical protein B0H17DRAFT_350255 [Mycena rosella]|uniref:Uncharacterized protein n=1 Tax=Mycena rosella TaxID=1033263 RepID=A0AAD7CQM9_MYCRO|nr:hypothetical protein B0H17DRAFT_350255 [Mycena rosella]